MCVLSLICLVATPWTVARQAPLSMKISRQEYWTGLPFPTPMAFPDPGIKLTPGLGRSPEEGNGYLLQYSWGFFGGLDDKENASNAGNLGLIPGSGRSPGIS